ncbi:hypothetical protein MACJ_002846 [Theileria orientalis]|uniref:VWFA domain-containing protein n=1 Tax=Theileria orientalis TaxID=68886 RepID=A0A976QVR2_THEOR|nr:hypothetical protein MACJ_002846 [Theileria orientalis]
MIIYSDNDSRLYPTGVGKPSGYCRRELDLTLLVDESSSINQQEWNKLIHFLKSLIRSINIAPNYAHISLQTFGTSTRSLISFLDPASKNETEALKIVDMLGRSKPAMGLTYTGQALEYIRKSVFHFGTRKTAPKAIILITDGGSTQPGVTSQASAMLRDDGVTMLVVGVKSAIGYECRSIVGCPARNVECPAFFMTNWDDIIRKVGNLMTEVCETIPKDAVCRPIWSDWSPCNVKCGPGTKFKKLMDVVTVEEQTVGTNGKPGKTCKEQFVNVEQPQEECMGPCTDKTHIGNPEQHVGSDGETNVSEGDSSEKGDEPSEDDQVPRLGDDYQLPEHPGEDENPGSGQGVDDVENPVPEEITNEPEESGEDSGEGSGEESGEDSGEGSGEESGEDSGEESEDSGEGSGEESGEGSDEESGEGSGEESGEGSGEESGGYGAGTQDDETTGELSHGDHGVPREREATVGEHHVGTDEEGSGSDSEGYPEEGDYEGGDEEDKEIPGVAPHSKKLLYEPTGGDYTKHESSHESGRKEESTKKEEFNRSGAMIAGGIILALLMAGAGGGYAYYRKKPKGPDVESGFGNDGTFDEATGAQHSQEGETYSVADLDDGLWSEAH